MKSEAVIEEIMQRFLHGPPAGGSRRPEHLRKVLEDVIPRAIKAKKAAKK